MARLTGLEPATPGVTGRYSNQLSYNRSRRPGAFRARRYVPDGADLRRAARRVKPLRGICGRRTGAPYPSQARMGDPMLKDLIARFARPDDPAPLPPEDARLALAALMVRAARADGDYDADERGEIAAVLADCHALSAEAVESLLREAEALEAEAPDTVRFTRLVKAAVPHEERAAVMEAIWRVVLADGRRDPSEDALLRQLAPLLGLADRESAFARRRVERRD